MLYELHNEQMTITADPFGAELHSLCREGREYLWQAGDAWKRHAPILFPFICSPMENRYRAFGDTYTMRANHGFARDLMFTLLEQTPDSLTFELKDTPDTLAQYPYPFRFTVRYTLLPDGVKVSHTVYNPGKAPMFFYIGGHPAFNCPLLPGERFEDYYVEYAQSEHITQRIDGKLVTLLEDGNCLDMTRSLFDHDAIILDAPRSKAVSLRSEKSPHSVTVEFPESGCIAVWSPTGDDRAAFVCLEPWTSLPVYADDDTPDLEEKAHAIRLAPGEEYSYAYTIRVQ